MEIMLNMQSVTLNYFLAIQNIDKNCMIHFLNGQTLLTFISPSYYIQISRFFWLLCADIEPLQTHLDLEEGFCKAVLSRLRFRKVLSFIIFEHYVHGVSKYAYEMCLDAFMKFFL